MAEKTEGEITQLLKQETASLRGGNRLWALVYPELRRRARNLFRGERPGHTLSATAVVNEVFLRLETSGHQAWQDRSHFYAVASEIMRHVLVDHARARGASKRGSGAYRESLDESIFPSLQSSEDGFRVAKEALDLLAAENDRAALVVALRVFGGLTVDEVAAELSISPRTVKNDWVAAKVTLKRIFDRSSS